MTSRVDRAPAARVPDRIHAVPVRYPARWVSAAVVALFAAMAVHGLVTNQAFGWPTVWKYLLTPPVVRGVGWTLLLTVAAMTLAVVLSLALAVMRDSSNPVMRTVSWTYVWFFRGTPVYTQLAFWGFLAVLYPVLALGIPFGPELLHFDTKTLITAAWLAAIGLGLNEAAYLSEIVRAGLESVDHGQAEAAKALGMKDATIMRRIVLPQAMRVIVPPTGNETISMLKTTSLVLAIPFTRELQYATDAIGNRLYLSIPLLVVACLWYLAVTSILMVGQHYLERYYGRGFEPHGPTAGGRGRRRATRQAAINAARTTPDITVVDDMGRPAGGAA